MPRIFISYRRNDSAIITGRINDRLVNEFGKNNVFLDVEKGNIPEGNDFRSVLQNAVGQCDVMLVIIGPHWLKIEDIENPSSRRLDNPDDFVRMEVKTGLERNKSDSILVIPVLVMGANMPSEKDLPEDLHEFPFLNARTLHGDPIFHDDMSELVSRIRVAFPEKQRIYLRTLLIGIVLAMLIIIGLVIMIENGIISLPQMSTPTFDPFDAANRLVTLTKEAEVAALATPMPNFTATIEAILTDFAVGTHQAEIVTANANTNTPTATYTSSPTITPTNTPQPTKTPTLTLTVTSNLTATEHVAQANLNAQSTNDFLATSTSNFLATKNAPTQTITITSSPSPTNTIVAVLTSTLTITPTPSATPSQDATDVAQALINAQATLNAQSSTASKTEVQTNINDNNLLYVVNEGDKSSFYTVDVSSHIYHQITTKKLPPLNTLNWSPDGHYVIFYNDGGVNEISITEDMNCTKPIVTLPYLTGAPIWSPDGRQIAFLSNENLFVMDVNGTNIVQVTHDYKIWSLSWAPDSHQIAFVAEDSLENRGIHTIELADKKIQRITTLVYYDISATVVSADGSIKHVPSRTTDLIEDVAWSPSGNKIAFILSTAVDYNNSEIYIMDADGSNPNRLTFSANRDINPVWSPDGNQIVFISTDSNKAAIYIMNADGSNLQPLVKDLESIQSLVWWDKKNNDALNMLETNQSAQLPIAFVANMGGANLRRNADINSPIVAIAVNGDCLQIVGRNRDSSWIQVTTGTGRTGWVAAYLITVYGDLSPVFIKG